MRLMRRRPRQVRRSALEDLLTALDTIGDPNYRAAAARIAQDIRTGGSRAARVHVADVAPLVADSFGAFADLNPICAALTAYGRDALDIDLRRIPGRDTRHRMTADRQRALTEAHQARQADRVAATRSRKVLRQLDSLRSFQR